MTDINASVATKEKEIVTMRVLDAPRELVFKMWTEPEHIAQWWGPNGFTNTIHEMDFRPGGTWKFTMHGPDGRDYLNEIIYREISEPERIVLLHASAPIFEMTVTFEDLDGKTKLTMHNIFEIDAQYTAAVKYGAVEGAWQTVARLEEYVAQIG